MKLCLGLMVTTGEGKWLDLHLPHLLPEVDGVVVVVDYGLEQATYDALNRLSDRTNLYIYARDWDWNFAAKANALIQHAEVCGFEAMLRLDPDETLYAEAVDRARRALTHVDLLAFSRYNFERDRLHWMPQYHPDTQYRAWRLHQSLRYTGRVHEMLVDMPNFIYMPDFIYHYEGLRTDKRRYVKHVNYARLAQGEPPLDGEPLVVPAHEYRPHVPFTEAQPLDPQVIGLRAPLEDEP